MPMPPVDRESSVTARSDPENLTGRIRGYKIPDQESRQQSTKRVALAAKPVNYEPSSDDSPFKKSQFLNLKRTASRGVSFTAPESVGLKRHKAQSPHFGNDDGDDELTDDDDVNAESSQHLVNTRCSTPIASRNKRRRQRPFPNRLEFQDLDFDFPAPNDISLSPIPDRDDLLDGISFCPPRLRPWNNTLPDFLKSSDKSVDIDLQELAALEVSDRYSEDPDTSYLELRIPESVQH